MTCNMNLLSSVLCSIIISYMFGMCVYSGYTADNNKPDNDSNGLFIASYIICILQCILYLGGVFFTVYLFLTSNSSESNSSSHSHSSSQSNNSHSSSSESSRSNYLVFLLNIYWVVVFFNYDISEKYDEYALVKTVEFFILMGFIGLGFCCICVVGLKTNYSNIKVTITNRKRKTTDDNENNDNENNDNENSDTESSSQTEVEVDVEANKITNMEMEVTTL